MIVVKRLGRAEPGVCVDGPDSARTHVEKQARALVAVASPADRALTVTATSADPVNWAVRWHLRQWLDVAEAAEVWTLYERVPEVAGWIVSSHVVTEHKRASWRVMTVERPPPDLPPADSPTPAPDTWVENGEAALLWDELVAEVTLSRIGRAPRDGTAEERPRLADVLHMGSRILEMLGGGDHRHDGHGRSLSPTHAHPPTAQGLVCAFLFYYLGREHVEALWTRDGPSQAMVETVAALFSQLGYRLWAGSLRARLAPPTHPTAERC